MNRYVPEHAVPSSTDHVTFFSVQSMERGIKGPVRPDIGSFFEVIRSLEPGSKVWSLKSERAGSPLDHTQNNEFVSANRWWVSCTKENWFSTRLLGTVIRNAATSQPQDHKLVTLFFGENRHRIMFSNNVRFYIGLDSNKSCTKTYRANVKRKIFYQR